MVADQPPADADVRHRLQAVADLLAAAGDRRERRVVGRQVEEDLLDLLVDRRGQQRQRLGAGLLGRERVVGRVRGEHAVHLAGRRAELGDPREHAERVVERELPALAGLADELLHDPERRLHELAGVVVPARQRRDVRESRAPTGSAASRAPG